MRVHNLSLAAFYRKIGIGENNHRHYIKGTLPHIKTAYKVSKVLEIPIWELWGLEE
jgi:hypothetical protein